MGEVKVYLMKNRTHSFILLILFLCLFSCGSTKSIVYKNNHLEINMNKKIDWKQFNNDLEFVNEYNELPLGYSAFPVFNYESSGNGNIEEITELCGFKFIQQSSFVYKGNYNSSFFGGENDPDQELVYFTILVRSEFICSKNQIMSSSRNHPTYLSQGIIHIGTERNVRWVALHNSESKSDMAIINMKHFDLNKGRLIIIFPYQDGSFRYKQINIKQESISSLKDNLLNKETNLCITVNSLIQ